MGELSWEVLNAVEKSETHRVFRARSRGATTSSLVFSLAVHGVGALVLSWIVVSQRQHLGAIFSAEVLETPPPKPQVVKRRMVPRPLAALRAPSVREIPLTGPSVAVTPLPREAFSLPTVEKESLKGFPEETISGPPLATTPRIAEVPRPAVASANFPVTIPAARVEVKPFSPTTGLTTLLSSAGGERRLTDSLEAFKAEVRRRIQQAQRYPRSAQVEGIEGQTEVEFVLRRDGTLESVEVIQPSGSRALDEAAVAAVKEAAPYPPLPESHRGERVFFRLDLIFRLAAN